MNRADKQRQARTEYSVTWTKFIQAFGKDASRLFCFFEGSGDLEYYDVRIRNITDNPKEFDCDGKKNVRTLYGLIVGNQKYQQAWVAFFIDKDFDDLQELPRDDRMYITPGYAIENFYVSPAAFGRMLRVRFTLTTVNWPDDLEGAHEEVIELYKQRLEEFNDVVEELNAWMYLQRLAEKQQKQQKKVNFNSINLKSCFNVQLDKIEKKYTLDYLAKTVSGSYPLDEKDVIEQAQKFHNIDRTALFRGKCEIEFLYQFITRLQKVPRPSFLLTVKHDLNLSKEKITADLSQYADTPGCLRHFLSILVTKRPVGIGPPAGS
jgi:hypothetical protein